MKQKIFLLILLVGTLFSCKEEKGEITFPKNQDQIALPAHFTGDTTITIRTEASWRAYVLEEADTDKWLTMTGSEGVEDPTTAVMYSGYNYLTITVAEGNNTFEERKSSIIIESYDKQYTIPVTQAADADITPTITDARFKAYLLLNEDINTNKDDKITVSEAYETTELELSGDITSLEGIANFTKLTSLTITGTELATIDVSIFPGLEKLYCNNNKLTVLDVSKNPNLLKLRCHSNPLTTLDLSNNLKLTELSYSLATLDISNLLNLEVLGCAMMELTTLNVTIFPKLKTLNCNTNKLETLDLSKNPYLEYLNCSNNNLTSLVVSEKPNLQQLYTDDNALMTSLVVSNTQLWQFSSINGKLTSLVVSNNQNLRQLDCQNNELTSLVVSNNQSLERLNCSDNNLTELDVSSNGNYDSDYPNGQYNNGLETLNCIQKDNPSTNFNFLTKLIASQNQQWHNLSNWSLPDNPRPTIETPPNN